MSIYLVNFTRNLFNPPTTDGVFAVYDQLLWCSTAQRNCCYLLYRGQGRRSPVSLIPPTALKFDDAGDAHLVQATAQFSKTLLICKREAPNCPSSP